VKEEVLTREQSIWGEIRFRLEASLRNLARPYINTFAFFEADLERIVVEMPPGTKLEPRLFRGAGSVQNVCDLLESMGNTRGELEKRMLRGDLVSIGFVGAEAVAYTWMTFSDVDVHELGLRLRLQPGEAVQYDTFVAPKWRGRGFQFALNVPVLNYAREHGYRKTLAWVHVLNTRSFKNQVRSGKRVIQKVISLKPPGTKRSVTLRLPGALRSRLIVPR
jgi:GNAT superfamily N-acetyltransferase